MIYIFGHSVFQARAYAEELLLDESEWEFIEPYNREKTEWLLMSADWSQATMIVLTVTNLQTFRILAFAQRHGAAIQDVEKYQAQMDHYALDAFLWT